MEGNTLLVPVVIVLLGVLALLLARPEYALYLYVFTIPLEDWMLLGPLGTLSRTAALIFFSVYLIRNFFTMHFTALSWRGWAWFALAGLSWLWAFDRTEAGTELFTLVQLFAVLLLIADLVSRAPEKVNNILWAYCIGAVLLAMAGLGRYLTGQELPTDARVSGFEKQSVAHFAAVLAPAFLFFWHKVLARSIPRWERVAAIVLQPWLLIGLIISGTRSAWVAVLVALLFVALPRLRRGGIAVMGLTAAIVVFLLMHSPIITENLQRRVDTAVSTGGAGRLDIWKVGFGIVAQHPLLGVGYANFSEAFTYDMMMTVPFTITDWSAIVEGRAPHNIYLATAAELGLIGLALFVYWLWPLMWRFHANRQFVFMQSIILAYLVQGIFLDVLNRKYFWLPIAIAEGIAYAQRRAQQPPRGTASRPVGGPLVSQRGRHHRGKFPQDTG